MTGLTPGQDRVAVLVARAWIEAGRLRARLTVTSDALSGEQAEVVTTASEEEVLATVQRWLDRVRGQ